MIETAGLNDDVLVQMMECWRLSSYQTDMIVSDKCSERGHHQRNGRAVLFGNRYVSTTAVELLRQKEAGFEYTY